MSVLCFWRVGECFVSLEGGWVFCVFGGWVGVLCLWSVGGCFGSLEVGWVFCVFMKIDGWFASWMKGLVYVGEVVGWVEVPSRNYCKYFWAFEGTELKEDL